MKWNKSLQLDCTHLLVVYCQNLSVSMCRLIKKLSKFKAFEFGNCNTHAFIFLEQSVISHQPLWLLHYFYYLLVFGAWLATLDLLDAYVSLKVTTASHLVLSKVKNKKSSFFILHNYAISLFFYLQEKKLIFICLIFIKNKILCKKLFMFSIFKNTKTKFVSKWYLNYLFCLIF